MQLVATGVDCQVVTRSFLDHVGIERGLSTNTIAAYRRDLRRYAAFLQEFGTTDLAGLSEADVASFVASLRTGDASGPALSESSVGRCLAAVRGLHKFALSEGLLTVDVARGVHPPRPARRLPKALTVDEIASILGAAASVPDGARA